MHLQGCNAWHKNQIKARTFRGSRPILHKKSIQAEYSSAGHAQEQSRNRVKKPRRKRGTNKDTWLSPMFALPAVGKQGLDIFVQAELYSRPTLPSKSAQRGCYRSLHLSVWAILSKRPK